MLPFLKTGLLCAAVTATQVGSFAGVHFARAQGFQELEARLAGHPSLEALDLQADAGRERSRAAMALPDPVITVGIQNFPVFDPSFDTFLPTHKAIGIRQALPSRAERQALAQGALATSDVLDARRTERLAALRAELILLLHHRHHLEQTASLLDTQDEKYLELQTVLEAEIGSGAADLPEIAEASAARARVERERATVTERLARISARLRDLVGEVPHSPAPPAQLTPWTGDATQFHAVRVADAAVSEADARVDQAEAAWRADWGIELTYQQRESGRGGAFSNFEGDDWVSGQVSFTLPLWAERSQVPRKRAALMDRAAAQAHRMAAARLARAEYETLDAARQRSLATITALEQEIAALEEQTRARLTSYEAGAGTYAPVIQGEIDILQRRADIVAQRALRAEAIARMNALLVTP